MKIQIVNVQDKLLSRYVQSFLFFSAQGDEFITYTTFPNTNLCLSIYGRNDIAYLKDEEINLCRVTEGHSAFKSRLFGFHDRPFTATIDCVLDQICILFHPGAIRAYTEAPFEELLASDNVFDMMFSYGDRPVLEKVFRESNNIIRANLLEGFLLRRLKSEMLNAVVLNALGDMIGEVADHLKIDDIAQRNNINVSTLYRLFLTDVGQSPKSLLQTIRFRKALQFVLSGKEKSLTRVAYQHRYYDQSHFNKEVKKFSGYNPGQLVKIISLEQEQLAWIRQ